MLDRVHEQVPEHGGQEDGVACHHRQLGELDSHATSFDVGSQRRDALAHDERGVHRLGAHRRVAVLRVGQERVDERPPLRARLHHQLQLRERRAIEGAVIAFDEPCEARVGQDERLQQRTGGERGEVREPAARMVEASTCAFSDSISP